MKNIGLFLDKDFNVAISEMYLNGEMSAIEISDRLFDMTGIRITARSLQQSLKNLGIIRSKNEAFQLAIKKGRKSYDKLRKTVKSRDLRKGINLKIRYQVLNRDNFRCVLCGNSAKDDILTIDHVIPVVRGGNNEINNLRTLCRQCNLGKMIADNEK